MRVASVIFGVLGVAANVLIYQQKSSRKILVYKMVSDVLWALHYFFLGAMAGTAVALIGLARETVFYNHEKKWASSRLWLAFFIVLGVVLSLVTGRTLYSLLPAAASALSVISFGLHKPKVTRALAFPVSACMLTYDVLSGSYIGIANEIFTLTSTAVATVRLNKNG